jgi:hypothetical protein
MSELDHAADGELLEECIDELDVAINELHRFPEPVLAFALRAHLIALLRSMLEAGQLGGEELTEFLTTLETEIHSDAEEGP